MARESKEEDILKLFLNQPTKYWHFSKIKEKVPISDSKISKWLKRFEERKLILKIKEKGRMPYYIGNHQSPEYKNTKRIFGENMLHKSGLLNYLSSLEKAKAVIIFGSFNRSDWFEQSDVDLFVYGEGPVLDLYEYEEKLKREIQLFKCENIRDIRKLGGKLMANIIKGRLIKGNIDSKFMKNALSQN